MAKKGIGLSNNDGRVTFSNTGSLSIDDGVGGTANNISASFITASNVTLSGISTNTVRLLSASAGTFSTFTTGTNAIDGGALVYNGTTWVTSSRIIQEYSGVAQGDLSGNYLDNVQVKNISNVSSGTLPINAGGTGKSLPIGNNYLMTVSSSGQNYVFGTLSAESGSVVYTAENRWQTMTVGADSNKPDVRFYTASIEQSTFTWQKPTGKTFARIILQGAGGGGGGLDAGPGNSYGGASGGLTDITLNVSSITSATINVGRGGAGGTAGTAGFGSAGGATSFTASFGTYSAGGGRAGNLAGIGLTKSGSAGGTPSSVGVPVASMPSGGGAGGSPLKSPGQIISLNINKNFSYTTGYDSSGNIISINIIDASGSSGVINGTPNKPGFGAGGGGGGYNSAGGVGGDGYALIISW